MSVVYIAARPMMIPIYPASSVNITQPVAANTKVAKNLLMFLLLSGFFTGIDPTLI
jgi:hypothetical protein